MGGGSPDRPAKPHFRDRRYSPGKTPCLIWLNPPVQGDNTYRPQTISQSGKPANVSPNDKFTQRTTLFWHRASAGGYPVSAWRFCAAFDSVLLVRHRARLFATGRRLHSPHMIPAKCRVRGRIVYIRIHGPSCISERASIVQKRNLAIAVIADM